MNFKIGGYALCVANDNGTHLLSVGKMYKIEGIDRTSKYIQVINESGYSWWYENHLFKPGNDITPENNEDNIDYLDMLKNF